MHIDKKIIARGYDRKTCWAHARCGILPTSGADDSMVITLQKSHMSMEDHVHDIFSGLSMMQSDDGGRTWSDVVEQPQLSRWQEDDGIEAVVCDFSSQWHAKTSRLLGIGVTSRYQNGRAAKSSRRRETAYSIFDQKANTWAAPQFLEMPEPERFRFSGAGCVQWCELPDGDILLPICFIDPERQNNGTDNFSVTVLRCQFDGKSLSVVERGNLLSLSIVRGFVEPSLISCAGKYWLSLRNDLKAYVSVSDDGLHFEEPKPWLFCDGTEIGSCNTQQHWIRLQDRLFLIYTRHGLDNDHVPRHRAPLILGEVERARRVILRDTEQILVPNRGAQLGNFGAVQRSDTEAWVCVSEWMENAGAWNREVWSALEKKYPQADLTALAKMPGRCGLCELSGSDNSIHLVKISV